MSRTQGQHRVRDQPATARAGGARAGGARAPATPDRRGLLDLQQLAGNRAVATSLGPRVHRKDRPDAPGEDEGVDRPAQGMGSARGVSFAFFFTGGDAYGRAARRYVEEYYPEHLRFEARSFEELFGILGREGRRVQRAAGDTPMHVDEVIVVSHANAGGGMKIPLTAADPTRRFTPADVAALQAEAGRGLHQRFQRTRAAALGGVDRDTRIVVRGCELGKGSEEPLDALAVLFGGQPRVMAPRAFQGFSVEQIGTGHRLKTPEQAFDWLLEAGYLTPPMAAMTKADKVAYVKATFGSSIPTDFFLVGEADYEAFKAMGVRDKLGEAGEGVKHRDERPTDVAEGKATGADDALWAAHQRKGAHDTELALPKAELVARAEALMADYEPTDAALFLRLWDAWQVNEAPDKTIRTDEVVVDSVLERRPAVFSDEHVWRARRDVFDHPDATRDSFATEPVAYAASSAAAADFSSSEAVAGVVDPATIRSRKRTAQARPLPTDAAVVFLVGFGEHTTAAVLGRAALPGPTATGDAELDQAMEHVRFVVQALRAGPTLAELDEAKARWRRLGPVVTRVLGWAHTNGFDGAPVAEGARRVAHRIDQAEVATRSRASEAGVQLPRPDAGLYAREAAELGEALRAHDLLLTELKDWDVRYGVRAGSTATAAAGLDAQVRSQNMVRSAVGWWAIWTEYQTLGERVDAAAKRGLVPATATVASFLSHGTNVVTESVNVVLGIAERQALAHAAKIGALRLAGTDDVVQALRADAGKLKLLARRLTGGAGVLAVVSGVLDLVKALDAGDERGARAAAHSIAQGVVQTGGAVTGAGTATTVAVSGGLVVVWATLEAIGMASDNIKGFERLQRLEEISRFLTNAASLVPWGKRMAGVADAWDQLEAEDPDRAFALSDDFLARARQPYAVVVKGMLQISSAMRGGDFSAEVGAKERAALATLEGYRMRGTDEFAPGDMRTITEVCVVLFASLQRSGAAAVRLYGPALRP